jgi:hypothetical protein
MFKLPPEALYAMIQNCVDASTLTSALCMFERSVLHNMKEATPSESCYDRR